MASREEEKRKRREEREALEKQDASARARTRRLQAALVAVLVIGAVVGGVIALTGGGSSKSNGKGPKDTSTSAAKIPVPQEKDLTKAAAAAGCVLQNPPIEGRSHVTTKVKYKTNPPTSGNHNPDPALDGIYDRNNTPAPEHYVHALEHGRVEIQYAPSTSNQREQQLETLASEAINGKPAYKVLLFQNNTNMPYAVAATAWGHLIGCKTFTDKTFDALRDFRLKWVDQGPEIIPPTN